MYVHRGGYVPKGEVRVACPLGADPVAQHDTSVDKAERQPLTESQEWAVHQQEILSSENHHCETTLHGELARLAGKDDHARGLLWVGLYKLSKFLFFGAVGLGALHLIHANVGDTVMRLAEWLRLGPESHIVAFAMDKADLVDHHQLREASMLSCGYAVLCLIEGTGLMLRRVWAEYFTVGLTILGLPVEIYELAEKVSWLRVSALVINLIVLGYLLYVLRAKTRE